MTSAERTEPIARATLEAVDLTKRYEDGVLALDHVSFSIHPGQIYAMLGANGAGKTTTINLFLNFIDPTEGEARVEGIPTHREPLHAKAKIAYVSENVRLYPNLSALQNLEFFAHLGGKTDCTKEEKIAAVRTGRHDIGAIRVGPQAFSTAALAEQPMAEQ